MNDGTIYAFLVSTGPESLRGFKIAQATDAAQVDIEHRSDNRIDLFLKTSHPASTARSQPVDVSRARTLLVCVTWVDGKLRHLSLNNQDIGFGDGFGDSDVIRIGGNEERDPSSRAVVFDDPLIATACADAIQWRRTWRAALKVKKGRIAVSRVETRAGLAESLKLLRRAVDEVFAGHDEQFAAVSVRLRSLLLWDEDKNGVPNSNYTAELFLVAADYELPLPIYLIPDDDGPPVRFDFWARLSPGVSIERRFATQRVADLKEWSEQRVLTLAQAGQPTATFTVRDLLKDHSNAMGGAHRDTAVPLSVYLLSKPTFNQVPLLKRWLIEAAMLVLAVGEFVLEQSVDPMQIRRPNST